jgi:hypothetical protein
MFPNFKVGMPAGSIFTHISRTELKVTAARQEIAIVATDGSEQAVRNNPTQAKRRLEWATHLLPEESERLSFEVKGFFESIRLTAGAVLLSSPARKSWGGPFKPSFGLSGFFADPKPLGHPD